MNKAAHFIRTHLWTVLMLVFIGSFHALLMVAEHSVPDEQHIEQKTEGPSKVVQELKAKEKIMQERLQRQPLLSLTLSLSLIFLLISAVYTDIALAIKKWRGQRWISDPTPATQPAWSASIVLQAFVFLYFIETVLYLIHILMIVFGVAQMSNDYYLLVHSLIRNFAVFLFVLLVVRIRFGQGLRDLGFTFEKLGVRIREGLRGYLAVLPPLILLFICLTAVMKVFSYEPEPQNVVQIFLKPSSQSYLAVFTLFVAIVGPVLEEVFFRGFAFAALRKKWGVWPAALLTSAVFAAFHMNAVAFLPILFLGLFLTYLYHATGSLVTPITAHVVHNTIMVICTLFFKSLTT